MLTFYPRLLSSAYLVQIWRWSGKGIFIMHSLPYIFRIGTLIASRAENADFFFISAKISVIQRPKTILYGSESMQQITANL
jgi:hypothetical protein